MSIEIIREKMMSIIIISLVVISVCIITLYWIKKVKYKKRKNGILCYGTVFGIEEIAGRPNRYKLEVDIDNNGMKSKQILVTFDNKCKNYHSGEQIPMLYIAKTNTYYWQEERDRMGRFLEIFLMALTAFFSLVLLIVMRYCK